jgi:uncharacterized membrane protein
MNMETYQHYSQVSLTFFMGAMIGLILVVLHRFGVQIDYQKYANVPMYACFLLLGGVILSLILIGVIKHRRKLRQQHEPR